MAIIYYHNVAKKKKNYEALTKRWMNTYTRLQELYYTYGTLIISRISSKSWSIQLSLLATFSFNNTVVFI